MQQQPSPKRRWWRARNLVCLGLLLAVGATVFCCQDWLFMSADLRRMQGAWTVVRVVDPEGSEVALAKNPLTWRFTGHQVTTNTSENLWLDASAGRFRRSDAAENEHAVFGFKFRLPVVLARPRFYEEGTYEIGDNQITFWGSTDRDRMDQPGLTYTLARD